jgi:hypothetical protein
MNPVKFIPLVGSIVDLGFWIADRVKGRRLLRQAEERQKRQAELTARLDRIVADAKKAK